MSVSKLNKEILKLATEQKSWTSLTRRETYLITDSKGRYLARENEKEGVESIKILFSSGTTVDDLDFQSYCIRAVRYSKNPIVIIWFGTCELTRKEGKFITLREDNSEIITRLAVKYRYLKSAILKNNPSATVLFLNCPYYSLFRWNKNKGCATVEHRRYQQEDELLKGTIDQLNDKLREINSDQSSDIGTKLPQIGLDLIKSSKNKNNVKVKYSINYNLLLDGIHPGRELSKLWLLRLLKLKNRLENIKSPPNQ